jgi:putative holliday junction resolvase
VSARTRLLGVDYGSIRVGLAVSDAGRLLASPLAVYERQGLQRDASYFRNLIQTEEIGAIVVGLPLHCDGREGQKATEVRTFGAWLADTTSLPVRFWDERFSTVEAEAALWQAGLTHKKRKARRDRVAAQILLQAYLDAGCPDESAAGPLTG